MTSNDARLGDHNSLDVEHNNVAPENTCHDDHHYLRWTPQGYLFHPNWNGDGLLIYQVMEQGITN